MDLSHLTLTAAQEAIVDCLAENEHNVWAKERIRQGWSYGPQQVECSKGEQDSQDMWNWICAVVASEFLKKHASNRFSVHMIYT